MLIKKKLTEGETHGADSLKLILYVSLLLLLILLNDPSVERDSSDHLVLITDLSYKMPIDFFDGVDTLNIILQENEIRQSWHSNELRKLSAFAHGSISPQDR